MSGRGGVSRGDRIRNARLARLREAMSSAIAGIDLRRESEVAAATDLSGVRGVRVGCRARQMLG
jgi:hypothetical protein